MPYPQEFRNFTNPSRVLRLPVETEEMYGSFSPDRSRLLTGGDGASPKVHIWDVETGDCVHALYGHREPVAAVTWSKDQQWVASGAFDGSVRIWDAGSGECFCVLQGHRSYVRSVDYLTGADFSIAMMVVAILACLPPALRALGLLPAAVLRME